MIRGVYFIVSLAVLTIFLLSTIGCSSASRMVITQTDTIYVERVVKREKIVGDTIETISRVVEYEADTVNGKWLPTKMVVENSQLRAKQNTTGRELLFEEDHLKSRLEEVDLLRSSDALKWIIIGFVISIIIFLLVKIKI